VQQLKYMLFAFLLKERLFFNVPVRKKFLKSDEKEYALCRELVQKFSMIHPSISFSLFHNDRKIFVHPAREKAIERILSTWKANPSDVKETTTTFEGVKIDLFLGTPLKTFAGGSLISVNNRIVSDRKINAVIYKVSRETIGPNYRATFTLKIDAPHDKVDVNVHPSKLEIRFRDEQKILRQIDELIRSAILTFREGAQSQSFQTPPSYNTSSNTNSYTPSSGYNNSSNSNSFINKPFSRQNEFFTENRDRDIFINENLENEIPEDSLSETIEQPAIFNTSFSNYKIVGTLFNLYIIIEMSNKVYFIDQHASHERITYMKLVNLMEKKSGLSQMRIHGEIVKLSPREIEAFNENRDVFNKAGFVIENFDEDSIVIRGVPAIADEANWPELVKDMVVEFSDKSISSAWDDKFLSIIATKACHSSVRHNDKLKDEEISALIEDINRSEILTCPHGRPFFFSMDIKEFEKRVQRC